MNNLCYGISLNGGEKSQSVHFHTHSGRTASSPSAIQATQPHSQEGRAKIQQSTTSYTPSLVLVQPFLHLPPVLHWHLLGHENWTWHDKGSRGRELREVERTGEVAAAPGDDVIAHYRKRRHTKVWNEGSFRGHRGLTWCQKIGKGWQGVGGREGDRQTSHSSSQPWPGEAAVVGWVSKTWPYASSSQERLSCRINNQCQRTWQYWVIGHWADCFGNWYVNVYWGHDTWYIGLIHHQWLTVPMTSYICSYLENKVVKIEKSEPQTRVAISTEGPRGAWTMAARRGRHSSRTPLRDDDRIRFRTEWNGNGVWELCSNSHKSLKWNGHMEIYYTQCVHLVWSGIFRGCMLIASG